MKISPLRFSLLAAALFLLGAAGSVAFAQTQPAYFTFGTASSQPTVGKSFTLPVIIDTGSQKVAGGDAIIRYDPQALSVVRVEPGEIFDTYPSNTFDLAGNIQISGAMSETTASFSGRGTFGTLTLRGNRAGSTTISFTCSEGQNNDSNILQALTNVDIIDCTRTNSTTLLIAAAPTAPPTAAPPAATASPSGGLGTAGSAQTSLILAVAGVGLLLLGGLLKWNHRV
jgi:hypothetical protein